jgi:uncharacterized protein (TIGR02757 family)
MTKAALKQFLDRKVIEYNTTQFIDKDPICIPHSFSKKQDIEIAGFFAATLAWGNRTSIINSCKRILDAMDHAPHDFLINHKEVDLKHFLDIKHRTFNATDLLYFIHFLSQYYKQHASLESAFCPSGMKGKIDMKERLIYFNQIFFALEHPARTQKHVSTPLKKSACKRLDMFLRWMVRQDEQGVDFGIWTCIKPSELICPLDVHVGRVAHRLGLIQENKADWQTAEALTESLRQFDANDPVKYDYALFGLGVEERVR